MTHALCSLLIPSVSRSLSVSKVSETSLKYSNKSKRLGQDRLSHYRRSFVILFSCPFRVILSLFFVISWKAILQENGSRKEIHRKKRSVKKKCQCAYIACLSLEKQLISKRFLSQNSWTFVMILPLFPKSSPWRETWVCLWHRVVSLDRLFMTCFSTTKDHLREIILFWEKRHKRVNLAADSLEDTHDSEDMILFQSLLYETPERKDHLKNLTRTAWSVFNEVFSGMSSLWYVVSSVCTCLWRCFRGWCLRPVLQCHSYFLVLLAMTHDPLVLCVFNWCWLSCVSNCDLSVDRIAPARQEEVSQSVHCLSPCQVCRKNNMILEGECHETSSLGWTGWISEGRHLSSNVLNGRQREDLSWKFQELVIGIYWCFLWYSFLEEITHLLNVSLLFLNLGSI